MTEIKPFAETFELSAEQIEELLEAFELFDSSGDGLIGASELHVVMQAIGRNMTEADVGKLIHNIKLQQYAENGESEPELESDEEEELDFKEFLKLIGEDMIQNAKKEELEEAYQEFNPDEKGITKRQLKETLREHNEKMSEEDIDKLFKETDFDGDGRIGFEDFVRMMMSR